MSAGGIGDGIFSGNWSIRRTMLAILLLLTIGVWSMGTLLLYLEAGRESERLFDQSLDETAHLLLVLADHEIEEFAVAPPHAPMEGHDVADGRHLLFQIWDANGNLRYKSMGAPEQPFVAPGISGFGNATIAGTAWRTYSAWNARHRLQIQVGEPGTRREVVLLQEATHMTHILSTQTLKTIRTSNPLHQFERCTRTSRRSPARRTSSSFR